MTPSACIESSAMASKSLSSAVEIRIGSAAGRGGGGMGMSLKVCATLYDVSMFYFPQTYLAWLPSLLPPLAVQDRMFPRLS